MKGRLAVIDQINGRAAAALVVDGRLQDLLIDPQDDAHPRPGAIYRAVVDRPIKGQNGVILKLGNGQRGFLRQAKGLSPGQVLLVQINSQAEEGKASPVTTRLLFKGRYAIITPDAAGLNVARSIKDEHERDRLNEIAHVSMEDIPEGVGLILRSAAEESDGDAIESEISALLETCNSVLAEKENGSPELLVEAPASDYIAWRDWTNPDPDQVFEHKGSFDDYGIWDLIDNLRRPEVALGAQASMFIETTRAMVTVDVNTGGDFSLAAGLKANLAAVQDLPRQLLLRGLGGQVVLDLAPMGKKERRSVEHTLKRALKADLVDTSIVGWTPLGHLELQRKRERLPLEMLIAR